MVELSSRASLVPNSCKYAAVTLAEIASFAVWPGWR